MKVLCVNAGNRNPNCDPSGDDIVEGNIYTVTSSGEEYVGCLQRNIKYYEFEEIHGAYDQDLFIPISEIDETEFIRKEREVSA